MRFPPDIKTRILPPALLAASVALVLFHIAGNREQSGVIFSLAERGWELLFGIRDTMIGFNMPLPSVLMAFIDHEPRRLALAVNASLLLLLFSAWNLGRLKGGPSAGALFAVLTALIISSRQPPHDPEQVFFMLLISVYLNLESVRENRPGLSASLLAGLALGCTLLFRSSLFLFPAVVLALELLRSARPRRVLLKEAAVFLFGAYILIVPWARLNHFAAGQVIPFEFERATSNIITGAQGSIYTMEGNARTLAGISREDSALKWAAARVLSSPGDYFLAVVRRVWHILKMFPVLVPLVLAALVFFRRRTDPLLAALPAYFILIHSLLSVEERYFYPLAYMMGFMAVSGAGAVLPGAKAGPRPGSGAAYAVFIPVMVFVLAVECFILAYPFRAAGDHFSGVEAALKRRPDHPWLLTDRAEWLLRSKKTEEGLAALRLAAQKAGGKRYSDSAAILRLIDSPGPPTGDHVGFYFRLDAMLFTALREFELGLDKKAGRSFAGAYEEWSRTANMLRGTPYAGDKAILEELRLKSGDFQDRFVFNALLYWPRERRTVILNRLSRSSPLSDKLLFLKFLSMPVGSAKDAAALASLAGNRRVMERAEPSDYETAARQLIKALLPLPAGTFAGGLGASGAVLKLLGNRETGLQLAEIYFSPEPAGAEEVGHLAAVLSAGSSSSAAKLRGLRPLSPLYLALSLRGMPAGEAARALEEFNERPGLLLDAAGIYAGRGGAGEAALLADKALAAQGIDLPGLRRAALVFQSIGRYREALAVLNKAIGASPEGCSLLNDRGVLHLFLRDRKAAERDFLAALGEPDCWQAQLNLAGLRSGQGRRAEAAVLYEGLLLRRDLPAQARASVLRDMSAQ